MQAENNKEILDECPWCSSDDTSIWGRKLNGFISHKCNNCELIFVKNPYTISGLEKYYKKYLTEIHQNDKKLVSDRNLMYPIEFEMVHQFSEKHSDVLDIGCSGGYFLRHFENKDYNCYGVEIGKEAAKYASKRYKIYEGQFPELSINRNFDIITFRGTIEHFKNPKSYLNKAIDLLNDNGMIFITSTPNSDSLCCKIFKEQWNQHVPEEHIFHFNPKHFDYFFKERGLKKIWESFPYEKTPYANIEKDVSLIAKAIELKNNELDINFTSPPYYKSMMSLIYKKVG